MSEQKQAQLYLDNDGTMGEWVDISADEYEKVRGNSSYTFRTKPAEVTHLGGKLAERDAVAVTGSDAVTLADALNTVLWLERRLPKSYDEVPHVQRTKTSLRAAIESSHAPVAQPLAPSGAADLTSDEADFVLRVLVSPGCKIHGVAADGRWVKPESLGLVKVVGSWKWEPTGKLVELLRYVLAAQPLAASAVPEGFVLVPIEPTAEMLIAGAESEDKDFGLVIHNCYSAMLAAAPSQQPAASPTEAK